MHGQFVWYELMTSSAPGAKAFYPEVAGWGAEDWPRSQYTMWTAGGLPLGGIVQLRPDQLQQGMRSAWMPYIESDDVDETARRAAAIGGRVLFGPQDIPGTGRFAVLADPQGAVFAILHSLSPTEGFDGEPINGRFSWHELTTTDFRSALEFYRRLFAWEAQGAFEMPDGTYQMYGMKGRPFGGMFNRTPEMGNVPPFWLCYVSVPDVKKAVVAAKRAGGKLLNGPMEVPGGGWIAVLNDPQGAMFALYQPVVETAEPAARKKRPAKPAKRPAARKKARSSGTGSKDASRRAPKRTPKRTPERTPKRTPKRTRTRTPKPTSKRTKPAAKRPSRKPKRR